MNPNAAFQNNVQAPTAPQAQPDLNAMKQQLMGAQSQLAGMGAPPGSINSTVLAPAPASNFQAPTQTPPYPVSQIETNPNPPLAPAAPTQTDTTNPFDAQLKTLNDQISGLNTQDAGKADYTAQLQQQYDLSGQLKAQNDLAAHIKTLQAEADGIQTYDPAKDPANAGRGITAAGIQPLNMQKAESLRQNAIKALGLKASFEVAQGNYSTALQQIDLAVNQKYAPIEANIVALTKNAQLIKDSPQYSLAEKKQAQAVIDQQTEKKQQLAIQQDDYKTQQGLAIQAQQNGAPIALVTQAMQAVDLATAMQLLNGYTQKETAASIQEYQFAQRNGYKGSYTQYQNDDANRKIKVASAGNSGRMFSAANINTTMNQVAGAFDNEPIVKNFNILSEGYQFAQSLPNTTTNPADDQGLIYAFAKAMDPGSVVREGEYATVQKYSQSWISSFGKSVSQAMSGTGFLSADARKNIKATIASKYAASKKEYSALQTQYQKRLDAAKSGQGATLTDYSTASPAVPQSQETSHVYNGVTYKLIGGQWVPQK